MTRSDIALATNGNAAIYVVFDYLSKNSSTRQFFQFGGDTSATLTGSDATIGFAGTTFSGSPYNDPVIISFVWDWNGGERRGYINGDNKLSASYTTRLSTNAIFRLFTNANGVGGLSGHFGEVLIMPNVDDASRQYAEGYLAWKWGFVEDLPNDHDYRYKIPRTEPAGTLIKLR